VEWVRPIFPFFEAFQFCSPSALLPTYVCTHSCTLTSHHHIFVTTPGTAPYPTTAPLSTYPLLPSSYTPNHTQSPPPAQNNPPKTNAQSHPQNRNEHHNHSRLHPHPPTPLPRPLPPTGRRRLSSLAQQAQTLFLLQDAGF